jgi:hypothetical protein
LKFDVRRKVSLAFAISHNDVTNAELTVCEHGKLLNRSGVHVVYPNCNIEESLNGAWGVECHSFRESLVEMRRLKHVFDLSTDEKEGIA